MNRPQSLPATDLGPCPYLDHRQFAAQVVPEWAFAADHHSLVGRLLRQGFRRNGGFWYRPSCQGCQACVALRVDTTAFQPRADQRRCARRNADLTVTWHERGFDPERQDLYRRYQHLIHGEDPANDHGADLHLVGDCPGAELQARDQAGRLLAVSILDCADDGLSSVYCYYDPQQARRSLGTFMVLQEIAHARERGLPWLYLGYSVEACHKMAYKLRFGPHQRFEEGQWISAQVPSLAADH